MSCVTVNRCVVQVTGYSSRLEETITEKTNRIPWAKLGNCWPETHLRRRRCCLQKLAGCDSPVWNQTHESADGREGFQLALSKKRLSFIWIEKPELGLPWSLLLLFKSPRTWNLICLFSSHINSLFQTVPSFSHFAAPGTSLLFPNREWAGSILVLAWAAFLFEMFQVITCTKRLRLARATFASKLARPR